MVIQRLNFPLIPRHPFGGAGKTGHLRMFNALAACSSLLLIRSSFRSIHFVRSSHHSLHSIAASLVHLTSFSAVLQECWLASSTKILSGRCPEKVCINRMGFQFFTNFATSINDLLYRWQPFLIISPFIRDSAGYQHTCLMMLCIPMACFPARLLTP